MSSIAFLDQYAGMGGGQQVLVDLVRYFRSQGDGVSVHLPGSGATSELLIKEGFAVQDLPLPEMTPGRKTLAEKVLYPLHSRSAARALVRDLIAAPPDILYCNGPRTFLPGILAAKKLGCPVFCGLHLVFGGGAERRLIRWCFSRPQVAGILFCSQAVAEPFSQFVGNKAFVSPYWVSPRFLEAPKGGRPFREMWDLSDSDLLVGVVGRISPTKGQVFFLDSLNPLLADRPRLHLAVAGSSDFESKAEEETLRSRRGASPAPERVHLHLEMVDPLKFMDSLDILVVPSLWDEPFGLVAVEGMSRDVPLVVTRSGGLAETVRDGETGYVVEKDARSLRDAVRTLVDDPSLRMRMGAEGRRRVQSHHHPDSCIAALRQRVLASAGS
jgi:glycosyltransferase involved in cell wall biosynthesis